MFEILLLVATKMKDLSWGDLISGYEVNPTRFSYDPNQVIFNFFFSFVLIEDKRSLLCKGLSFSIPPKKIEYEDFLTQFKLLYTDTMF